MGKYQDFLSGGNLPPDDEMEFYEDAHASAQQKSSGGTQTVSGSQFGINGSIVMYEPHTPEDVELIINYLKTRQFAIVQLTNEQPARAQRILDMLAGAVYAINGSMAIVNREQNVYLMTPEGVSINVPLMQKR